VTDRLTNRKTDHGTQSVTIGHIYVHSTAMRRNNNEPKNYESYEVMVAALFTLMLFRQGKLFHFRAVTYFRIDGQ